MTVSARRSSSGPPQYRDPREVLRIFTRKLVPSRFRISTLPFQQSPHTTILECTQKPSLMIPTRILNRHAEIPCFAASPLTRGCAGPFEPFVCQGCMEVGITLKAVGAWSMTYISCRGVERRNHGPLISSILAVRMACRPYKRP